MNRYRNKTIPSPELLIKKKIKVEVRSCELIGQRALESSDDEYYCRYILHHKNLKEIREQNTFKGEFDCFQFYIVSSDKDEQILVGIVDPTELWDDPYIVDYHVIR